MEEITVDAHKIQLKALYSGEKSDPLAIILHGFPDSPKSWVPLGCRLVNLGFRVVIPWMRGYYPSPIDPNGQYLTGALAMDAISIHEHLEGDSRSIIIGHDYGAMALYGACAIDSSIFKAAVAASVPPAGSIAEGFLNYDQLRRSWYMFFFQSPFAEFAVAQNDLNFIERLWQDWSPGISAEEYTEDAKAALREPGHLNAALSYYKAVLNPTTPPEDLIVPQSKTTQISSVPTLYIHGFNDGCIGMEVAKSALKYLPENSKMEVIPRSGHFLQVESPEIFNDLVCTFVSTF
ncbi:MAG: alpha/beta hydrolase [Acidimicrobiales bacterium]|nr:alpha/beta hydrolase [Acidimicrobiales bacterium]